LAEKVLKVGRKGERLNSYGQLRRAFPLPMPYKEATQHDIIRIFVAIGPITELARLCMYCHNNAIQATT